MTSERSFPLEPVGQVLATGSSHEGGEVVDGVVGDGEAGEHHPASLCASSATRS